MDLHAIARTLMANGVLLGTYLLGSLAFLVGVTVLLSGPRPRPPRRRTAGTILSVVGLALAVPSVILGVAATSSPGPVTPRPNLQPAEDLIACTSDGVLPPVPSAPPAGCVLVIEWGEPEVAPTGLLVTTGSPDVTEGQAGHWWYHSLASAEEHIQAFCSHYPDLPVLDLR